MKLKSLKAVFASIFARLFRRVDCHHSEEDKIVDNITSAEGLTEEVTNSGVTTTNPLSIKYKLGFSFRVSLRERCDTMEGLLKAMDRDNQESRSPLRSALLYIFMNDDAFKDALRACDDVAANRALLELGDVSAYFAQVYVEELAALRDDAIACREAEPQQMLDFITEAIKKDAAPPPVMLRGDQVVRMSALGLFNKNSLALVKFFLEQYAEGVFPPTAASGTPSFLTPATFKGWGGPNSTGQTFSFMPEMIESGFVEIECDNWGGWNTPGIESEWSSGVKVVKTEKKSVILECDKSRIKSEVTIAGRSVSTYSCGKYVASICEEGEFDVNIYYRSKDMSKRICVFTYDFCCK